jgi:hypothetical protein
LSAGIEARKDYRDIDLEKEALEQVGVWTSARASGGLPVDRNNARRDVAGGVRKVSRFSYGVSIINMISGQLFDHVWPQGVRTLPFVTACTDSETFDR